MTEGLVETNGIAPDFAATKTEASNGYGDHEVGAGSTNGNYEGAKLAFDESYMPVPGLQFTVEQDGYRYYADPQTQRQYSLDTAGYWYVMNDDGYFEAVEIPVEPNPTSADEPLLPVASQVDNKDRARSKDITYDDDGFPVFPTNEKGLPVLPRNESDQPIFPLDPNGKPVFPYDRKTGLWTFPVDDCEDPIFPRTEEGNPIVPQDQSGNPIFPKDKSGEFIFPVDESNFPIPAVTLDGTRVLPTDEFSNPVIPRDREGKPLIHFAADGVTPLSNAEYKVWKQFQKQYKNYPAQHHAVKSREAFDSPLHPLNLAHQASLFMAEMEILQRGRRVRPEDIDLPDMSNSPQPGDENYQNSANGSADQAAAEDEKAQKRRKFLAAQLKSTKKVADTKKDEPMGPKEPPGKPTSNPLAVDKRKSRSSSKTKRDASSSPDAKHRHKKVEKNKGEKKRSHHKEKPRTPQAQKAQEALSFIKPIFIPIVV
ncbi:hypothetical protein AAVH_35933 [Aphelenchoides avenae]|nr:hypothetical protein AAVH_35933 [Aphelenchus avenae]